MLQVLSEIKTVLIGHWSREKLNTFCYRAATGHYVYFLYHTSIKALEIYVISAHTYKNLIVGESPKRYLDYLLIENVNKKEQ